jgi:hypothetical protein
LFSRPVIRLSEARKLAVGQFEFSCYKRVSALMMNDAMAFIGRGNVWVVCFTLIGGV